MTLTCCIIDDEPLAVHLLESYVSKTPFLDLKGKYNSAISALSDLQFNPVDLLFLDIQMPELNGMEFSRMLSGQTRIIFTTAFEQYALESYKVNALDYLLKPIRYTDFLQAAQKALQWMEKVQPSERQTQPFGQSVPGSIFIKADRKLIQLELNKIRYIEGLKDYVKIYMEGNPRPILSLMSMKSLEELLPPEQFIRVHRSYIVPPAKIEAIERSRIIIGKVYIPISDNYKDKFQAHLSQNFLFPEKE